MSEQTMDGAVYVQTNEATNKVVAFRRAADGALSLVGEHDTEGAGNGEPHLPSQGSVVLTSDGRHLLVTNVASDDVSAFAVVADGGLEPVGRTAAGPAPRSVAEYEGLIYVLATGEPTLTGFRLGESRLDPIPGAIQALSPDADPAQVGFTPDGSAVIVTERGTDSISAIPVQPDGRLGPRRTIASSGPTPYGFGLTSSGTLVVTEAFGAQKGAAAASSYSVAGAEVTPVTKSVGNGRSEMGCLDRGRPLRVHDQLRRRRRVPVLDRRRREPDPRRRDRGLLRRWPTGTPRRGPHR